MTVRYPVVLGVAAVLTAAMVAAYVLLQRRRASALAATGLGVVGSLRGAAARRHLPYVAFLAAMPLLLVALARPEATVAVPRVSGTVMLVFDVSNSMAADDLKPTRLAAAQAAARSFVEAQPDEVDIGVVAFGLTALATLAPTADHAEAIAAINRLRTGGGTSLGQAILAALSGIVGKPVRLPDSASPEPTPSLGYWGSATIVLLSDGENTAGPDVEEAALLAADAGVRIQTVGIGTTEGTTIEVDGYQFATALDEELLTSIAAVTGGSYRRAGDADTLREVTRSIDLRITAKKEPVELTALFAGIAVLLLTIGGLLMTRWYGRIV
jgi:Ca-activated chloride channel family protein